MVHSEDRSGFLSLISLLPEPQSLNREMVSGSTFLKGDYILGITKDFLSPFSSHPAALCREHSIARAVALNAVPGAAASTAPGRFS